MKEKIIKILILFFTIFLFNIVYLNTVYAETNGVIASGDCGDNITWLLKNDGVLSITGTGNMPNSTASAWADYQSQVKSVVFSEGITSISDCAFECNNNIENINLPSTVTSIGRRSFAECSKLKNITFPKEFVRIGASAFYKCTSLETIDLPDNTMYISTCAFAECISLKSVTIRSFYVSIGDDALTINDTATIYGHNLSSAFYYARYYGRKFIDLETNKISTATITNSSYLNSLPTKNVKALGITTHHVRTFNGNVLSGYQPIFCNQKDNNNEAYKKIKDKVNEITANCSTDREKAYAIFRWVYNNMTYQYGHGANANIKSVYAVYENLKGSCEAYTVLTNYMLYLCDIPTATVSNLTHMWTAALVDGKWIYIDSTNALFDSICSKPNQLTFAYNDIIYAVDDPTVGAYATGIAKEESEIEKLSYFTIPTDSYMKGIYETAFPSELTLKAKIGTLGEDFIKKYRKNCYGINNNIITGAEDHNYKTQIENGYNVTKCSVCNHIKSKKVAISKKASGVKVKEQKTNSIKLSWSKQTWVTGYKVYSYNYKKKKWEYVGKTDKTSYTVKKLKAGTTYKYRVRAYNTVNKKEYYGEYSTNVKTTTKTKTPEISKLTKKSKKATIKWKKVSGATGYEIYMSTSKKGKYSRIKNITKGNTVSYTKSKLKKNKKYYFKIRTYRTVDGKKVYSSYSSVKSIKI